jgi:hypothetical protein
MNLRRSAGSFDFSFHSLEPFAFTLDGVSINDLALSVSSFHNRDGGAASSVSG